MAQSDANRIREKFLGAMNAHQRGNLAQAENAYRRIIDSAPEHAGSIHNLGLVLFQLGNAEEAVAMFRRALEVAPDYDEAYNNLGVVLESQGLLDEAHAAYRRALELKPDYATAYGNLGDVLYKQGRFAEAESMYRKALRLEPANVVARVSLGNALWSQKHVRESEEAFREAVRLEPGYPEGHNALGKFLADQGDMLESERSHRRALELEPERAEFFSDLGNVLGFQGRARESEQAFRHALRLKPDLARVYWYLSSSHKYDSVEHADVASILELLCSTDLARSDAMHLNFALGKIYDDCKAFDKAFSHFEAANRIGLETASFNAENFSSFISQVIDVYSPKFFAQHQTFGSTSRTPAFIVGMLRSGTTLVEQIIASHGGVFGAGELDEMREIVDGLAGGARTNGSYPECVEDMDEATAMALARDYLSASRRGAGESIVRVLDKMPSNFLHLGLIALLFPNARVIHCRRDPLDTCLSIYFQNFSGVNEFAYDLSHIGAYYRQYDRLMAHWREVLPLGMYEIRYEDLVSNMEEKTRELVAFLDLEWDEQCLRYDKNPRGVVTSSSWQVRQPVYKTSVQRWRNYEKFLGPLKESLGTGVGEGS